MTTSPPFLEEATEPELAIVDPHHHIWDDLTNPLATYYPLTRLIEDVTGGHNVVGSVYLECTSHWRAEGPEEFRPVGETEWILQSQMPHGIMAGIVGYADLRRGRAARPVVEAHIDAGRGRFRGIRHSTSWSPYPDVPNTAREVPPGTLTSPDLIDGVRMLGELGLTFDAWMYFDQLPELVHLAKAAPDVRIVLDHLGGPLAIGPHREHRAEMLAVWRSNLARVAELDNVLLKVGGLGMSYLVGDERTAQGLRGSDALAAHWRDEVQFAIDAFGPARCMLESNFPVDSYVADYVTLWNAFKKLTSGYSADERRALFHDTAVDAYRLGEVIPR